MVIEPLNPLYTFQTFFVASSNQFAQAAALAVSEAPGLTYNPLYVFGGERETRKHLLHAIGHAIKETNRQARILYTSAERLVTEPNDPRRCFKTSNFPELEWGFKFETNAAEFGGDCWNVDLLLVEDIHLLTGHEEAQEKLLRIFNHLYDSGKQMVFSSDHPPRASNLPESLESRFEWGLIADLEPMGIEAIIASLQRMAEIRRINVSDEVIYLIARKVTSPAYYYSDLNRMQSLEFIVDRLAEAMSSTGSSVTPDALVNEIIFRLKKEVLPEIKRVQVVNATAQMLEVLRRDYANVFQLSPESFELLICDRLSAMGFDIERVGSTNTPDGGVDIIAWPHKPTPFPFLLAAQVKHHMRPTKKTGPSAVKDLQAVLSSQPFQAGLLVTSTTFTPNARWFAANQPHLIRLRDMDDLQRWIWNNFTDNAEWREIPSTIELAPGVKVKIPL